MSDKIKDLYTMKLHDCAALEVKYGVVAVGVVRVPGGWVYTTHGRAGEMSSVFVPFDNEFMKGREGKYE